MKLYKFSVTENAHRKAADERASKPFLPLKSAFKEIFQIRVTVIERNQSKRALTKSRKGGFFLRKKPLGSLAFGVQLL